MRPCTYGRVCKDVSGSQSPVTGDWSLEPGAWKLETGDKVNAFLRAAT